ncbi:MAG: JAB domain-containing protein [Saprospiraceae bacterium]|nr:JAB domain-containing protein [Saprospiraceae bacterium]
MKNSNGESQITPPLLQVAEVKVIYKSKLPFIQPLRVNSSTEAEKIFRANWSEDMELVEEFNVLFLNRANYVKGIFRLSRGGLTGTVADPRILFATALKSLSVGVIAGHNHPSGSTKPSPQDIELTRKLKEIGRFHEITLIDHLILTPHSGFYSFADEGML